MMEFAKCDWELFAGAEKFDDGDPLIADEGGYIFIHDRQSITVIDEDGDEQHFVSATRHQSTARERLTQFMESW